VLRRGVGAGTSAAAPGACVSGLSLVRGPAMDPEG
jgi:hypothetical protein